MRKRAPTAARRRGGDEAAVLRQGFAKLLWRRRGVGEGRGCALDVVCSPPLTPLFIGEGDGDAPPLGFPPQGWQQPPDAIWVAARRGEREGAPGVGLRAHLP